MYVLLILPFPIKLTLLIRNSLALLLSVIGSRLPGVLALVGQQYVFPPDFPPSCYLP